MIDCRAVKARLGRFLDGELAGAERAEVQSHVQGCPTCYNELAALQALAANLDSLVIPPVPENLAAGVISRLHEANESGWGIFRFWKEWSAAMRVAACATAMAACVFGAVLSSAATSQSRQTDAEMSWVGLAAGAPLAYAYGGASR